MKLMESKVAIAIANAELVRTVNQYPERFEDFLNAALPLPLVQ